MHCSGEQWHTVLLIFTLIPYRPPVEAIKNINNEIKKGTLKNRGDEIVKESIDAGLLREDRKYIYPIREDIPIMLIDEAIPFEQFDKK